MNKLLYKLKGKRAVLCKDLQVWANGLDSTARMVATDFVGEVKVSTVFLGVDHNFSNQGPPILFETMVFGGMLDREQQRYATWEKAEAGHKRIVKKV